MEANTESKDKPPKSHESGDEPPLMLSEGTEQVERTEVSEKGEDKKDRVKKPCFLSKRKSKDLESQIQGVLIRQLIYKGYNVVVKRPKKADKSLPFLTIITLEKNGESIDFKESIENTCKAIEQEKNTSKTVESNKLLKYKQRR